MPFRCLFHVHTRRSFDSLLSPRKIVAKARELGVHALVVTDHDTIQGSLDVRAVADGTPPLVATAAEYQSEKGDIIGVFLKQEIRSPRSDEIIHQIHAQGGLVVLPHPSRGHLLDDKLLAGVDLIESYNSRCSERDNAQAVQLAEKWDRPVIAGADAHCSLELGSTLNEFMAEAPRSESEFCEQLLHARRRSATERTSVICRPFSQMVKAVKTRNPGLFLYQAKRLTLALARGERP